MSGDTRLESILDGFGDVICFFIAFVDRIGAGESSWQLGSLKIKERLDTTRE